MHRKAHRAYADACRGAQARIVLGRLGTATLGYMRVYEGMLSIDAVLGLIMSTKTNTVVTPV